MHHYCLCSCLFTFTYLQTETPEEWEDINKWLRYLYVVSGIIRSRRKIRVAKFKQFCTDAMVHLKTKFEWKNVAEHVHEVLAHIWVAIEMNGGYGLGPFSEVSVSKWGKSWKFTLKYFWQKFRESNDFDKDGTK